MRADASTPWSDPAWAAIAELLRERAGLVFTATRRPAAEGGMRRAMERAAVRDPRVYAATVAQGGAALDDLLAELTVGETYFFREPAQFDFVRREVAPAFRAAGARQPMRVWSAACATGEEPYSLAITLAESGVPASVLGTDVSRERLAAARRARYRPWSLRGVPEPTVGRYFRRTGAELALAPEVRRAVEFRYLNLASDVYPSLASGVWGMDLVLCRNVLIYFDHATIARVAVRLLDALAHDGWLLLGASDPPLQDHVPCEVTRTGAGLAYRRRAARALPAAPAPLPAAPPLPTAPPPPVAPPLPVAPPPVAPAAVVPAAVAAPDAAADVPALVARATALANAGELAGAARACEAALDRHRDVAALHHLQSVLLAQTGHAAAAAAAARRALYLDRGMVVAHLALGDALARDGRRADAGRAFAAAERLLAALPADAAVPGADGEHAGRLLAMVRVQRALLARGAA